MHLLTERLFQPPFTLKSFCCTCTFITSQFACMCICVCVCSRVRVHYVHVVCTAHRCEYGLEVDARCFPLLFSTILFEIGFLPWVWSHLRTRLLSEFQKPSVSRVTMCMATPGFLYGCWRSYSALYPRSYVFSPSHLFLFSILLSPVSV